MGVLITALKAVPNNLHNIWVCVFSITLILDRQTRAHHSGVGSGSECFLKVLPLLKMYFSNSEIFLHPTWIIWHLKGSLDWSDWSVNRCDHQGQEQHRLSSSSWLFFYSFMYFISDLPVNSVFVMLFDRICCYFELVMCSRNGRYLTDLFFFF